MKRNCKKKDVRQMSSYVVLGISFFVIFIRLFFLQIQNGEENRAQVDGQLTLFKPVTAPRGEITDRYGRPIVSNRTGWFIEIEETKEAEEILKESAARVQMMLNDLGISCMPPEEPMKLPHTLAEDVGIEAVLKIKENSNVLPGIVVSERPVREYLYPQTASHLLGHVGRITEEEYEEKKDAGYQKTDYIGKQGVEKAYEEILRGTNGIKSMETNEKNPLVASKEPRTGDTVMLTLDIKLQLAAEAALKRAVDGLNKEKSGGAAVVVDVNSGEVLACASYPTYDLQHFSKDYQSLLTHPAKPMFHRAVSGLYAPGSTFKMISAIAALETKSITPTETIETKGVYEYFDRNFQCNIYRQKQETHGKINLSEALGVSCNYYFYEVGKRVGIEEIAKTAARFSLGKRTGILPEWEEAEGNVASPEKRAQKGGKWYAGDVLQAAIGQSDHLFTPVGLANYAAALANGGKSFNLQILYGVKHAETGEIEKNQTPKVTRDANVSRDVLDEVIKGMQKVTEPGGTAGGVFADFSVSVAGKTGSAQVPGGTNGLFLAFAPAEKPQIALSVVIENGGAGSLAAMVGKEIFSAYFEPVQSAFFSQTPYTVLP